MPKNSTHKLAIKSAGDTAFSLDAVVSSPRQCTPMDLQLACENLCLENLTESPPELACRLVRWLLTDFFSLLHRTGLYNRQRGLWEALGVSREVRIMRASQGVLAKIELPILEISFFNSHGRQMVLARLFDDSNPALIDLDKPSDARRFMETSIKLAQKAKAENGEFGGLIMCCPEPAPEVILTALRKLVGTDAVSRYQSVAPGPLGSTVDLVSWTPEAISLIHPDIPNRIKIVSSNLDTSSVVKS
jgi:hypothetical protein